MSKEGRQRNQLCPCGSGLKFKHCHGDQVKTELCNRHAKFLFYLLVQRTRLEKKVIDQETYDREAATIAESLIQDIIGKDDEHETKKPEKQEDRSVDFMLDETGLKRCSECKSIITKGTKCFKCGKADNE